MKFLLPLIFLASSLSQLSAQEIFLDDVMSKEEQKKTGVYKLTAPQKIELENWLNRKFILKEQTEREQNAQPLSLSMNIDNGQKIELSDNSIWDIAPGDVIKASAWITPFPVKLSPSNDPDYPYFITNTVSGDSVKAKRWVKPPSNPLPQK